MAFLSYVSYASYMKMKSLYIVSFIFALFSLGSEILSIPVSLIVFQRQGISSEMLSRAMSMDPLWAISFFGSIMSDLLAGTLLVAIIWSLLRDKVKKNRMTDIAAAMISIRALASAILFIYIFTESLFLIHTNQLSVLNMTGLPKVGTLIIAIFSLIAFILFTIGYIKEKIVTSQNPKKDMKVILPSIALLVVIIFSVSDLIR